MSKPIAAGLICLGIVTVGLAVSRGQEAENSSTPRNDALARDAVVEQANGAGKVAEQNVEIQKLQNECDVAAAELRCELARLDLRNYTEGDMVHEKNVLQAEVELATEEQTSAQDKFAVAQQSAKKEGAGKQADVEIARVALVKAKIHRAIAAEKLTLLLNFRSQRRTTELQSQAKQCERELQLVKLKADAALARATAELAVAKRNLDIASEAARHQAEKPRVK